MFNWSRFSALFLAAGIGVAEALNLVANEPTVMRHALMLAAVALLAGAALTDGKRRLGVLLGVWCFTGGVFATGMMVRFDAQSRFVVERAPAFLPRMSLGMALCVAGVATIAAVMARRERGDISLPDDTQYR